MHTKHPLNDSGIINPVRADDMFSAEVAMKLFEGLQKGRYDRLTYRQQRYSLLEVRKIYKLAANCNGLKHFAPVWIFVWEHVNNT